MNNKESQKILFFFMQAPKQFLLRMDQFSEKIDQVEVTNLFRCVGWVDHKYIQIIVKKINLLCPYNDGGF